MLPKGSFILQGDRIFDIFFEQAYMRYLIEPVIDENKNKSTIWDNKVKDCFQSASQLYEKFFGSSEQLENLQQVIVKIIDLHNMCSK